MLSLVLKGSTESAALVDELDVNAVMELAEQTDVTKVLEGWAKEPHVQLGAVAHSMAVLRVREIRRWEMSGEYQDMFKGAKPRPFFR